MNDKCFCHLNGYAVKDATARREIETMKEQYATKTYVDGVISGGLDLDNYATKEDVANAILDIDFPETDLTDYATKEYVDSKCEYVLYSNDEGTQGNIVLNDSVSNYKYIEVFYGDNYSHVNSIKVYNCNNQNIVLNIQKAFKNSSGKVQSELKSMTYKVTDDTLTITYSGMVQTTEASISMYKDAKYIVVYRIVGYK